jgi:hypothetical protein
VNRNGDAKKAASKAGGEIAKIESLPDRVKAMRAVAEAYGLAEDSGTALDWMAKAQQAAGGAETPAVKVELLGEVAAGYSALKKPDKVATVIDEMKQLAAAESDPAKSVDMLIDIAQALNKGKIDGAMSTLDAAVAKVKDIPVKGQGVERLCAIIPLMHKWGETAKAKEVYETARQLANQITVPDEQADALQKVNATGRKLQG